MIGLSPHRVGMRAGSFAIARGGAMRTATILAARWAGMFPCTIEDDASSSGARGPNVVRRLRKSAA